MKKIHRSAACATAIMLISGIAQAELIQYAFTDTKGNEKTVPAVNGTDYINPIGVIKFALSAGIDRKLRATISDARGIIVYSHTTDLLGPLDRITVENKNYYGKIIETPSLAEGEYTIRAEIISATGAVVQVDSYKVVVDISPPTFGELTWKMNYGYGYAPDGIPKWSPEESGYIKVSDFSDEHSKIKSQEWRTYFQDGPRAGSLAAQGVPNYSEGERSLMIGAGQIGSGAEKIFLRTPGKYRLDFIATDNAGNQATKSQTYYENSLCNGSIPESLAVYESTSDQKFLGVNALSGFVGPVGGVQHVSTNPARVLFRVPKSKYLGLPGGEIYGGRVISGDSKLLHVDEQYAYFDISGPVDINGQFMFPHIRWTNDATFNCAPVVVKNASFNDNALPPVLHAFNSYIDGVGWVPRNYSTELENLKNPKPPRNTRISKMRVTVAPRSYEQQFTVHSERPTVPKMTCSVLPGSTECEADTNWPFNTEGVADHYLQYPLLEKKENLALAVLGDSSVYDWDASDPIIGDLISHDSRLREFIVKIDDPMNAPLNVHSTWGRVILRTAAAYAVNNSTGARSELRRISLATNGESSIAKFSYSALDDGSYSVHVDAVDSYNNFSSKMMMNVDNDKSPPQIKIDANSEIASLDEIVVHLSDNKTINPSLVSINLKGGPSRDDIYLAGRNIGENRYSLEYPVMFPSLSEGEDYVLTVKAKDEFDNESEKSSRFIYLPSLVTLANDEGGQLLIPAVTHEFKRKSGNILETKPLTLKDGSIVNGVYSVSATLRTDAKVPLVINGVTVAPGETKVVASSYNFGSTGGKISLPLRPAVGGVDGTSGLLITTTAPNSPMLVANVGVWTPAINIQKNALSVLQGLESVSIKVNSAAGSRCRITLNEAEAKGADMVTDPVCFLQWDKLPEGVEPSAASYSPKAVSTELIGQVAKDGEHTLEYSLFMFDITGQKVLVSSGSEHLSATPAIGSVVLAPTTDVSTVNRLVQDLDFRMGQIGGKSTCTLTMLEQRAKNDAQSRGPGTVSQQCLFEWIDLPEGLEQDAMYDTPVVRGVLADKKTHDLKWRVSLFTRTGQKVVLNEQSYAINAIDPQPPELSLTSKYQLEGSDIVVVPMSESSFGLANISAARSTLDIDVTRDAEVQTTSAKAGNGANTVRAQRVLQAVPAAVWTMSNHKVRASYNLIPEVFNEKSLSVYVAPSLNIKPMVSVDSSVAVDSVPYPVQVSMIDRTKPDALYEEAVMGRWKIRLIREMAYNKSEPLTDFVDAIGGVASFDVDLLKVDATSMRFNVEAVLESPVEGYARTEIASRSTLVSIVRGGLIEGSIKATRLSGQAPFKTSLKLALTDPKNTRYTGAVSWEVSTDGGATWEASEVAENYKYQFTRAYELGTYKVRAKIINVNTGVSGYTEAVEIVAYNKAKAYISGARSHFVGGTAKMQALLKNDEQVLNSDDYDVEWSLDGGTTFTATGNELTLQESGPKHIKLALRAKPKVAPVDDRGAQHVVRLSVDFLEVKPPRTYVSGPMRMEKGKNYTFTARTTMPYQNMSGEVKGFFTLPNGQQVEGETATYSPSDEDLQKEFVETKYTAWIEGFRERGAETSSTTRSRTWEYIFPNFGMEIRRTASASPATVTAIVRPIGFTGRLEDPSYTWTLPEGATVIEEKPTIRVFTLNTHGVFPIKVTIGDARGNQKVLEQSVVLGESNPYQVDLQHTASNTFNREPLTVQLRPYVTGGHPLDRVTTATYFVNGEAIEATSSSARATLPAGNYAIRYVINSRMGAEASGQIELTVQPNKPPVCKVSERATIGSRVYNADCTDPDGRVRLHEWMVNGQVAGTSSSRLSVNLKNGETPPSVTLVGIDDAGARSEPVTAQPSK